VAPLVSPFHLTRLPIRALASLDHPRFSEYFTDAQGCA
jgi:hypothetical protein